MVWIRRTDRLAGKPACRNSGHAIRIVPFGMNGRRLLLFGKPVHAGLRLAEAPNAPRPISGHLDPELTDDAVDLPARPAPGNQ